MKIVQVDSKKKFHYSSFGWFSNLFFLYTLKFVNLSNRSKKLDQAPEISETNTLGSMEEAEYNTELLMKSYFYFENKKPGSKFNIWRALYSCFKFRYILVLICQIIMTSLQLFDAIAIYNLINVVGIDANKTIIWTIFIIVSKFLNVLFGHHGYDYNLVAANKMKLALSGLIYKKILKLSLFSVRKISVGKIVNILANDFNIFQQEIYMFCMAFTSPFAIIGIFVILSYYVGWYSIIPFIGIFFTLPIQSKLNNSVLKNREQRNHATDERIRLIHSSIDGIRLLKLYTWDIKMSNEIKNLRKKEHNVIEPIIYADTLNKLISLAFYILPIFFMLLAHYLIVGKSFSAAELFITFLLVGILRLSVLFSFLTALRIGNELHLMFQRIQKIQDLPEINMKKLELPLDHKNSIEIQSFSGSWEDEATGELETNRDKEEKNLLEYNYCLKDISINIKNGSLNLIIGKVGSGKSSFLNILLSEMPVTKGEVRVDGKIALVEQEPIIFPGTVLDNILFGAEYNDDKIKVVVHQCCLETDIELFPNGLQTQIGEKGITLSGGQKARLSFARAVYSNADIYLLDDPLSAVDSKVAHKLFNQAIKEGLKGKTILLATHHVKFAQDCDNIIILNEGSVSKFGSYIDLNSGDLKSISSNEYLQQTEDMPNIEKPNEVEEEDENNMLVKREDYKDGVVSWKTYKSYFREFKPLPLLFTVIIFFLLGNVGDIVIPRIFGLWSNSEIDGDKAFIINGCLILFLILNFIGQSTLYSKLILRASTALHDRMVDCVIRAKVEFFDRNPIGRILNRFSNDMGVLDKFIVLVLLDVFHGFSFFISQFIAIWSVQPWTIFLNFAQITLTIIYTKWVRQSIFDSKSLDLTTKGPIFSHVTNSLHGIHAIRLFKRERIFLDKFFDLINQNSRSHIAFCNSSRAFGLGLNFITIFFISFNISIIIALNYNSRTNVGYAILILSSLPEYIQWCFRQLVLFTIMMSSASRIISYSELPTEPPLRNIGNERKLKADWPVDATLEIKEVTMRYRENLEPAIKNLSLTIKQGEKIAIIGRTGSGKSSLLQVIFRMVEIESGEILIDGINVKSIGLHTLRKNISVIPQSPNIFLGSIRKNIDPFNEYSNEKLWNVLENVFLKEKLFSLEDKLDTDIYDSQSTFSTGEKQLLCLARAIIKKNKFLVLDEATSNVDNKTDQLIQESIRKNFKTSTVLCVAHRLSTIIDFDRVIVMDNGTLVEEGSPYLLLVENEGETKITKTSGYFLELLKALGENESNRLFELSRKSYFNK